MTDRLTYLYAVVPADAAVLSQDGIGGPTRTIVEGDLGAIVGDVPPEEFDEGPLNARMGELEWLGPRAAQHQAVTAAAHEAGDAVLPVAFGAVYRDEESVRELLSERAAELRAKLDAVRGRAEWVVALLRDIATAQAEVEAHGEGLAALRRELANAAPGRAYLLTRQFDEARRDGLRQLDSEAVADLRAVIDAHAERFMAEPLAPEATGGGMVSRVTLLVPREREAAFRDALDALARSWAPRGYAFEATGPWPAYRFGGGA